jgi:WD40 repeat protein
MTCARPILALSLIVILLAACAAQPSPTPPDAASATPQPSPSSTPRLTSSPAPSATLRPTPAPPPTTTPLPTSTPTLAPFLPALAGTPVIAPAAAISPENFNRLELLARWGSGTVQDLSWSPDGNWLAVKTYSNTYMYPGGDLHQTPKILEGNAVFGPGDLLAAYTPDDNIQAWRISDWKALYGMKGTRPVFSPDGKLLAALDGDTVRLRNSADGSPIAAFNEAGVNRVYFSPGGSLLVSSSPTEVYVWNTGGSRVFTSSAGRILRTSFSNDGSLFFVQSRDAQGVISLGVWQAQDWSQAASISANGTYVVQPDGKQAFIFSNYPIAGQVTAFNLPDGKQAAQFRAGGSIYRLAISPDSKILAFSIPDPKAGSLELYNNLGKLIKKVYCEHSCDAGLPLFSGDGKQVFMSGLLPILGNEVGVTAVYDPATGGLKNYQYSPNKTSSEIDAIALAPDGSQYAVYSGGEDKFVEVWGDSLKGALDWGIDTRWLGNLSPDDAQAAAYNDRAEVKLLNLADGSVVRQFEHATLPFFSHGNLLQWSELRNGQFIGLHLWQPGTGKTDVIFSPDITPPLVFSASDNLAAEAKDAVVRLMMMPSGRMVTSFVAAGRPNVHLNSVAFSPDGSLIAAGDTDGGVWLWRVADRSLVFSFEGEGNPLVGLAISPDGKTLATADSGGSLALRPVSGEQGDISPDLGAAIKTALGVDTVFDNLGGLAYSPDGLLLAVTGTLNPLQSFPNRSPVILLLQAGDGKLLQVLHGGGGQVAFTADGRKLVVSGDGTLQVWGVRP